MILKLATKNIFYKPLNTLLSLVLLTSGVGIISLLILMEQQIERRFSENIEGVDLVLGAQGSPLQLILSAVYQMDSPTGNISYKDAKVWMNHPFAQSAIPLAFGDSYRGFKILGTTEEYLHKYDAKLASGRVFSKDLEVVIGSAVAEKTMMKIGDKFHGVHGDVEGGEVHENAEYIVTGIAVPTGKVIDNLIVCNIPSVWVTHGDHVHEATHDHHRDHAHDHDHDHVEADPDQGKEITAVLFKIKNKMAFVTWPRMIAQNTKMQMASPAVEVNRLFALFGFGIQALKYLAYGIMFISAISIFIALYNRLKERKYEYALMRISGAGRFQMFSLVLIESLILCVSGFILGSLVGRLALLLISAAADETYKFTLDPFAIVWEKEVLLLLLTIFVGILAALIPAFKAYKLNISKTLANA